METRKTIAGGVAVAVGVTLLSAGLILLAPREARAETMELKQLKAKSLDP